MATTQEVITKVLLNNEDANKKLDELNKKVSELRERQTKAFKENDMTAYKAATKEINRANREMKAFQTTAQHVNLVLENLSSAGVKDLENSIRAINRELASGRIERNSEEWKVLQKALKQCKAELAGIKAESQMAESRLSKIANFFNTNWGFFTQALGAITTLSLTIRQATKAFLDWDSAMANVRKYTGQAAAEVEAMNEKFKQMDTRTAINDLNGLAGAAGRLGITAEKDIMEFVDAADKINVALGDDLGKGAVDQIGKLAMAFGEDDRLGLRGAMLATGSAINELAQNSAANAGYLVEFGARIAAVGNQVGLTQAQIFGLGAALDENMQKDEMAATAVSQLLIKMTTDTATFARLAGKPVEEFSKMVREDFNGALTALFQNLNKVGDMESLAHMFEDMGLDGTRCVTVLATMAGKIEDITRLQDLATKAYKEGTSVIDEYNVQNTTLQAEVDKAKKKFLELSAALGKDLLPVVKYTVSTGSLVVKSLSTLINFLKDNWKVLTWATVTLTTYIAAINAATIATKAKTLAIKAYTAAVTFCSRALQVLKVVLMTNPIAAVTTIVLSAVAAFVLWRQCTEEATVAMSKEAREAENLAKAKQHVRDVGNGAAKSVENETTRIRKLSDVLHNSNMKYHARLEALNELKKIVPEYNAMLTKEGEIINDNTEAIDGYIQKLVMEATVKAFADDLAQMNKELAELERKKERIQGSIGAVHKQMENTQHFQNVYDPYNGRLRGKRETTEWKKQEEALATHQKRYQDVKQQIDEVNARITETNKALDKTLEKNEDAVSALVQGGTGSTYKSQEQLKKEEQERKRLEAEKKRLEAEALKARKEADKEAQAATTMHIVALNDRYTQGEVNFRAYQEELYKLQRQGLEQRRACWAEESNEYARYTQDMQRLDENHKSDMLSFDLDDLQRGHQRRMAILKAQYQEENSAIFHDKEALDEALFQEDIEYLRKKQALYHKGTKEWYQLEVQMSQREEQHALDLRVAYAEKLQEYREQFGKMDVQRQQDIALQGLDALHKQGLVAEEEYQRMRLAIIAEFSQQAMDMERDEKEKTTAGILAKARSAVSGKSRDVADSNLNDAGLGGQMAAIGVAIANYRTMYDEIERMRQENLVSDAQAADAEKQLRLQTMQEIASAAQAAYNSINQIVNAGAAYAKACSDYEVASITANYDKQIAAAGNNQKKKEKLEKERDEKVKAAKKKANEKAMKIELAQAVASTAMGAINAYSSAAKVPLVGYILAPIAAATALAAGALQIATIKKQHATEALGYYSGGFTGGRRYRKEAGVVHEGEFVANHQAVNNPNLLPFFEFIDQAQKNNTVSSLTDDDVRSISGGGSAAVVAPIVNVSTDNSELQGAIASMNEAVARLNAQLEAGIEAPIYLDGPDGLMNRQRKYNKLKAKV